ncbi:MAG TPA: beta galactosidase jelly roll domain-containing protein [Polyangiaceae bacterium]|jgi:beta-galactosidase
MSAVVALVTGLSGLACSGAHDHAGGGGVGDTAGDDGGGGGGAGGEGGGAPGSGPDGSSPGSGGGAIPDGGSVVVTPSAPPNHRVLRNLNYDWRFSATDTPTAKDPAYDDSKWNPVSLPHTWNDVDTFQLWINCVNGPTGCKSNSPKELKGWYRKHFTADPSWQGRKVYLEFEGVRNAAEFWVNGTWIGRHENQIGPAGLDVTDAVKFGADNVITVRVDNNMLYREIGNAAGENGVAPQTTPYYQWSAKAFYPLFGGIVKDVRLWVMDKVHQTLPLYSNLGTTGVYVYPTNMDPMAKTANLTFEAEVQNETATPQDVVYTAWAVDATGQVAAQATLPVTTLPACSAPPCATQTLKLTVPMTGIHFWAPDYPYMYTAFTELSVNGQALDVAENHIGIRKADFDAINGLRINGRPFYLKGYSPRTPMGWAVTGISQDWMVDYDLKLMKAGNANFIRPMHVAPRLIQIDSADRQGVIMTCPAGDGEGDTTDPVQWDQRLRVMRDVTIYFRNHPSLMFYEASNSGLTYQHMQDMHDLRNQWDPHGDRFSGLRGTDSLTDPVKDYESPMDTVFTSSVMPSWDAEYARAEAPRRVWDKDTPTLDPNGNFVTGGYLPISSAYHQQQTAANGADGIYPYPGDVFRLNSTEDLALNNTLKFWYHYSRSAFVVPQAQRASKGIMVGGSKIFFADCDSDGRMVATEVARVSGAVDAVRLPKQSYYAMQVAQNPNPQAFILGHWSYAAGTVRTVWVVANTDQVHLVTYDANGNVAKDYGTVGPTPISSQFASENPYAFQFPNVAWAPGKIVATGITGGSEVATDTRTTVGAAASIKLTPVLGPQGFFADGSDIAMVDVEVVDANGQRVPTDQARVDFAWSGTNAAFLGGYNSGIQNSIGPAHLNTEAGINRVFLRATRTPGDGTLTATRGSMTASVKITAQPWTLDAAGLTDQRPQTYPYVLPATEPPPAADTDPTPGPDAGPIDAGPVDPNAILANLAYHGGTGNAVAQIVQNVQATSPVYEDQAWSFGTLPSQLQGATYIESVYADGIVPRSGQVTDMFQFDVLKPAYLYLLFDAASVSANQFPTGYNGVVSFTKQTWTTTINGRTMDVYKSALVQPQELVFPANGDGNVPVSGANPYVILGALQ